MQLPERETVDLKLGQLLERETGFEIREAR